MIEKIKSLKKSQLDNPLRKSMFLSALCKPASMLISLLYTPILLNYLGEEAFGVWSTILSMINWINFFDVGIGQGLRNSLTKYLNENNKQKANQVLSTGYTCLSIISITTFIIGTVAIICLDIGYILNTNIEIRPTIIVSLFCICINFILSLSKIQLYAIQKAEKVGYMTLLTQTINLFGVIILSLFSKNSLIGVAIVVGSSGIIVNLLFSFDIWKNNSFLIPRIDKFSIFEMKTISNIGLKFFLIQIAALILYSTDNLIISRLFGPEYVTPYNTSYSAFGILNGIFAAMLSPLWSRYTIALQNNEYSWIKKTILNLCKMLPFIAVCLILGALFFEPISQIWLHKKLAYEKGLVLCMAAYFFLMIWGSIYATALNGMGHINLQLYMGIIAAIINIPLSIYLGKSLNLGTTGVCLATVICMLCTNIPIIVEAHIFLNKKINSAK